MKNRNPFIQDKRVNAPFMTWKKYLFILLVVSFVCGSNVGIYFLLAGVHGPLKVDTEDTISIILVMLGYLLLMSFIIALFVSYYRNRILMGPTKQLCDAAKKVAQGDYSVRLAPHRKDGKKDEFEVLFEDFNTMAEELGSTEMMKNDFVSTVSHELKTPLSIIGNYASLLQDPSLSEKERQDYAFRIQDATKRMSILVTDILQINRLDNQKIRPQRNPFNLSESIARCILNYDDKLNEKNISLDSDMDENIIINQDEDLLDHVWSNLLSNAIKFTPENGRIHISARREENNAVITFSDNGCGISLEAQKHIFDKFYQEDTSHATQGNGLGLALVKRIVDLSNGKIEVDSRPDQGSSFIVTVPMI